ncbi:MAG: hypothetical protein HQ515_05965, partial [Phycisphaeraceae bacterium]|nr:hypothetical protein [Phycisphaeraceae bacterium]
SGTLRLYIDGWLQQQVAGGASFGRARANRYGFLGVGSEASEFDGLRAPLNYFCGYMEEIRLYDRALTQSEVNDISPIRMKAHNPRPKDGTSGATESFLWWTAGDTAASHNVYLDTHPGLTDADLIAALPLFSTTYQVYPSFASGIKYYWRVDEIERDGLTRHTGDLWTFRAAPDPQIVWVGEFRDLNEDGGQDDQSLVDWLVAEGYSVDIQQDHWIDLDSAKIGQLNAADLVIVGPALSSGNYDDSNEPELWNSVTAPLMLLNTFLSSDSRWGWLDTTTANSLTGPITVATTHDHPIFADVALDPNSWTVAAVEPNAVIPLANTTEVGNGMLIAEGMDSVGTWIAEWEPKMQFFEGAGQSTGGHRMLFSISTEPGEATSGDMYGLAAEGRRMLLNAIEYMLFLEVYASNPRPSHAETSVSTVGTELSWTPGFSALSHNVYLGKVSADVSMATPDDPRDVLRIVEQETTTHEAGGLEHGTRYYWRVDEVNADGTITKGRIWWFRTEFEMVM